MKSFEYVISDENGIHARPAGILVKAAKGFISEVTVTKGEEAADAKKLFALMGLCVKQGDSVRVSCDGPDEDEAMAELEKFFHEHF